MRVEWKDLYQDINPLIQLLSLYAGRDPGKDTPLALSPDGDQRNQKWNNNKSKMMLPYLSNPPISHI